LTTSTITTYVTPTVTTTVITTVTTVTTFATATKTTDYAINTGTTTARLVAIDTLACVANIDGKYLIQGDQHRVELAPFIHDASPHVSHLLQLLCVCGGGATGGSGHTISRTGNR
jgi:hypothetical protein